MRRALVAATATLFITATLHAQCADIAGVVGRLDGARMKQTVEKLVSFGTRHTLSDTTSDTRGIGAARRWIFDELTRVAAASNGRMTVSYQSSMQQGPRTNNTPVEMINVVATIRGTTDPDRIYIATGHYDSMNSDIMNSTLDAPGADDDASGVAVIMDVARALSQHPLDATVMLVAVQGEEQGLLGSRGLAEEAVAKKWNVEGMITNDIVGGTVGGEGDIDNRTIRIFSANTKGAGDGTSRHWARFVRDGVRLYLPSVKPRLIYRLDRFGRGGDHSSFFERGFPAIRFTEANEDYKHEHQTVRVENGAQYGDLPQFVSGDYMRLVASVNAVALVTAACAPAAPKNVKASGAVTNDTTLSWDMGTDTDLAGYEIVIRETTSDEWEKVIPVGKVARYTLKDFTIDNVFMGVRAVDADGNRSPVRTPEERLPDVPAKSAAAPPK
ncbi:MAG TPA: M20/M25/M40 family metallo-hydrolase [Thermoanaerobaculia bacterium]|nr:M20/M25/M40 family metallo-hydrolase [Thermoanaerobaculia bacterium]